MGKLPGGTCDVRCRQPSVDGEWREWLGMHLYEFGGHTFGYAWGLRACMPWHAVVGRATIGTFSTLQEAKQAIEGVMTAEQRRD